MKLILLLLIAINIVVGDKCPAQKNFGTCYCVDVSDKKMKKEMKMKFEL